MKDFIKQAINAKVYKKVDYREFHKTISKLKQESKHPDMVDLDKIDHYKECKCFLSDDKHSVFAIQKDGNLTAVMSKVGSGQGLAIVLTAIKHGANKLDCYDMEVKSLCDLYYACGFYPVARVKFVKEYNPKWKEELGTPDVVAMKLKKDFNFEETVKNATHCLKEKEYQKLNIEDKGIYIKDNDYDEMLKYRDNSEV